MDLARRQFQRNKCHQNQAHISSKAWQPDVRSCNIKHNAALPKATHQHQSHYGTEQPEVGRAVKAQTLRTRFRIRRRVDRQHTLAPVKPGVEAEKDDEQRADQKQGLGKDVTDGPEKINTLQKPQKQRRITQWRQGTTRIGHDEDEEHDNVRPVQPVVIGADQWADQQH